MKSVKRIFQAAALCSAVSLTIASCGPRPGGYSELSGYAQGGVYSVKFKSGKGLDVKEIGMAVDSILTMVDTTLSGYNKGSQLSRYNAGIPVVPNAMFKEIFTISKHLYAETGGALDVASGQLFDAWGFGFTRDSLPSAATVDSLKAICGMDKIDSLDSNMSLLSSAVRPKLNFNAIAQGYSCDKIADYLHSKGIRDMLVNIGEIYCEGLNPSGKPWTIGVDMPVDGNAELGSKGLVGKWQGDGSGVGVVTSGNYRKFYVKDGRKYSHTIDPRTGYPVTHTLLSATIVAPDATLADAYATYCMVIGLDEAKKFIESLDELEGYLVYDDAGSMAEWASSGFNLASDGR